LASARALGVKRVFHSRDTDQLAELIWDRWAERLFLPVVVKDETLRVYVILLHGEPLERFLAEPKNH
jgi:hypothetical protein